MQLAHVSRRGMTLRGPSQVQLLLLQEVLKRKVSGIHSDGDEHEERAAKR